MSTGIEDLMWRAYAVARPYVFNSSWMKELLEKLVPKVKDVPSLKAMLKDEIGSTDDTTKRTDINIYLSYLERLERRSQI